MKILKALAIRVASLFVNGELAISFDEDRRWATAYSRGHKVRVQMVAGAAFEVLEANLPLQVLGAAADYIQEVGVVPSAETQPNFTVQKVSLTPFTVLTGAGTAGTRAIFTLRKQSTPPAGGAAVMTVVATLDFIAGVAGVAEEELNIPLSAVAGATTLIDGDVLEARWLQGATGLALPASVVKVELA